MIRLNVFIQANCQNRAEMIETAKELVNKSINDNGCIAYDLFESATRNEVLMICETWKDNECLTIHSNSKHFTTLVPKMQQLGSLKIEQFEF